MNEKPHPLAVELAELARPKIPSTKNARALVLGGGSGRNMPPLLEAGLYVDILEEEESRAAMLARRFECLPQLRLCMHKSELYADYIAILSTHGLLHGTEEQIADRIAMLARVAAPQCDLLLTFGSIRDPRCGQGNPIGARSWAASEGSEIGIPHTYYDETDLRLLLAPFIIVTLKATEVQNIVGSWAHTPLPQESMIHWIAHAKGYHAYS